MVVSLTTYRLLTRFSVQYHLSPFTQLHSKEKDNLNIWQIQNMHSFLFIFYLYNNILSFYLYNNILSFYLYNNILSFYLYYNILSFYLYSNMHCDVACLFSFFNNTLWFTTNYLPSSSIKCWQKYVYNLLILMSHSIEIVVCSVFQVRKTSKYDFSVLHVSCIYVALRIWKFKAFIL